MITSRLTRLYTPDRKTCLLTPRWLAKVFVTADIISFFVQAAGGSMLANQDDPKTTKLGQQVYMAGVGVQLAFVVIFVGVVFVFWRNFEARALEGGGFGLGVRGEEVGSVEEGVIGHGERKSVVKLIWAVLAVLTLIIVSSNFSPLLSLSTSKTSQFSNDKLCFNYLKIRIIFRLVEFSKGTSDDNVVLHHEWYQLVFDAIPMVAALVLLNIVHPGPVLQQLGGTKLRGKRWWTSKSVEAQGQSS
jgi:hypothetical protein